MQYSGSSASARRFLPPAVAVSTVAFALRPPAEAQRIDGAGLTGAGTATGSRTTLWIPLVRRTRPPFAGQWALPGGPIPWDETLVDTALRTLHDAVLREPGYLEQLYAFGAVERSAEAQRLVTIAYWALIGERELDAEASRPVGHRESAAPAAPGPRWDDPLTGAGSADADDPVAPADPAAAAARPDENVAWFSADALPPLAFDHADIVAYALWRLRRKTEYSTVAYRFLGPVFTLAQLRQVHEAILGQAVDPANFRRQALAQGYLVDTGELETGTPYRPARLYRFRAEPDPELRSAP